MHRTTFLFFLVISYLAIAQNKYEKYLFVVNKDTLPYKLLRPLSKFSNNKLPLVLFFHGAGERGTDNEIQSCHIDKMMLDSLTQNTLPCYFIAPQCPKEKKWVNMDWKNNIHEQPKEISWAMNLTHKLVDSLKIILNIDTTRIYITGLSMGGFGTWDYCARYTNEVAAAVPVCGGYDVKVASKIKSISFWVFHGSEDKLVFPENSRRMVNVLKKLKANVKYSELKTVKHNAWVQAYKDDTILKWMFTHKIKESKKKKN